MIKVFSNFDKSNKPCRGWTIFVKYRSDGGGVLTFAFITRQYWGKPINFLRTSNLAKLLKMVVKKYVEIYFLDSKVFDYFCILRISHSS